MCHLGRILLLLVLILSACADDDRVEDPPTEEAKSEEVGEDKDQSLENPPYPFVEFDLEATFDGVEGIVEVEYEIEESKIEASYEDESQNIDLSGDEALQHLDRIFSAFDFDEHTDKNEVLDLIIEAFNLPKDATIDLEIEFISGEEKHYMQM